MRLTKRKALKLACMATGEGILTRQFARGRKANSGKTEYRKSHNTPSPASLAALRLPRSTFADHYIHQWQRVNAFFSDNDIAKIVWTAN